VKLVPRHDQVIGRVVIEQVKSTIIRPDQTKGTTKLIIVDAVGEGAAAKGIAVGDILIPTAMGSLFFDGGSIFRPFLEEKNAGFRVSDVRLEDLHVQTDNGQDYVPFDSDRAAKSMGGRIEEVVSGAPV
jgi:hypothetical protein